MNNDNLRIWNALSKTDPAFTKGFQRGGGFKGTAIDPMWRIKRVTEQFGPAGIGWGTDEPTFQVVPGVNGEVLVYCIIACWIGSSEAPRFHGVGGDKIVAYYRANNNRPERWENNDEAFKMAKTDAIGDAFKLIGVGADVHLGLFDDSKYVEEMEREFAAANQARITEDEVVLLISLCQAIGGDVAQRICKAYNITALSQLPAANFDNVKSRLDKQLAEKAAAQTNAEAEQAEAA